MPGAPRKSGHSSRVRGLSHEKVCVPRAVNRNGKPVAKIANTGRVSTKDLHHVYDGYIAPSATLVTNKMNSCVRFSKANGNTLVQVKMGKAKKGIHNIQHVNNYHRQRKKFMRKFNGVSTKYLNNYLVWHNFVNQTRKTDAERRLALLTFALTTLKTERCGTISHRPNVPLAA